jgi:hypothetical protein
MSKDLARSPQSYENEELLLAMLPELLEQKGFASVTTTRVGAMKFIDAKTSDGSKIRFWLKQGWTDSRTYSAVQFGMFKVPEPGMLPDKHFTDYVAARVASAKNKGASHALLVHMVDARITNYVALEVDDVAEAYRQQMAQWRKRARNTKTPTLWFEDSRDVPESDCTTTVTSLELPLSAICGLSEPVKGAAIDSKKITAEVELRMRQQAFRLRVGKRCGWRCVVTGTEVKAVLDAAHLPGKNWRHDNEADDGVLVRTDLHRLLDRGLAELRKGTFWLAESVRQGEYAQFHNQPMSS